MLAAGAKRFGAFRLPGGIRLDIANESIVQVGVSCIVNAAKRSLEGGGGIDGVIHAAAGRGLLQACKALPVLERGGVRCRTGGAKLTPGPFAAGLVALHVIHVVGPDLRERGVTLEVAEALLKSAVSTALTLADAAGYPSIAVPAVSCGIYGAGISEWTDAAPAHILRACVEFGEAQARLAVAGGDGDATAAPPLSLVRIVLTDVNTAYCSAWQRAAVELGLPVLDDADEATAVGCGGAATSAPARATGAAAAGTPPVLHEEGRDADAADALPLPHPAAVAAAAAPAGIPVAFDLPTPPGRAAAGGPLCRFLAIGDWGDLDVSLSQNLANNMAAWVRAQGPAGAPDFVLALGDNFYHSGVSSRSDPAFRQRWADVFVAPHAGALSVPWCVILGNHDCMDNPMAQVEYTAVDPLRLWRMPARTYGFTCGGASFFGVDTCGCQFAVQRVDREAVNRLHDDIASLGVSLAAADPLMPKLVFGHHTLYTKGAGHVAEAKCLRLASYASRLLGEVEPVVRRGFGLERILARGGAAAYFCGHEHVMQAHPSPPGGVATVGVGATCETYFYRGEDRDADNAGSWPAWVDPAAASRDQSATGFAQVDVWADRLCVTFIRNDPPPAGGTLPPPPAPAPRAFHSVDVPLRGCRMDESESP